MAKSNKVRQSEYRARNKGHRRLSVRLKPKTAELWDRLKKHYGDKNEELIERALISLSAETRSNVIKRSDQK